MNAAGPWVDEVIEGSDAQRHDRLIGGTKGSHLVSNGRRAEPRRLRIGKDGRPAVLHPPVVSLHAHRHDGPAATTATLRARSARRTNSLPARRGDALVPGHAACSANDVLYTYCGVRPLPWMPAGTTKRKIPRSHFIIDHVKTGGPSGLLSIVGGKLTTYRALARMAIPAIRKHAQPSQAAVTPGARPTPPPVLTAIPTPSSAARTEVARSPAADASSRRRSVRTTRRRWRRSTTPCDTSGADARRRAPAPAALRLERLPRPRRHCRRCGGHGAHVRLGCGAMRRGGRALPPRVA